MTTTTHHFRTTGDAYDSTQCRDEIKTGDTLIILDEAVVGLAWAWPITITQEAGALHQVDSADGVAVVMADAKITPQQVRAAIAEAKAIGLTIRPGFEAFASSILL